MAAGLQQYMTVSCAMVSSDTLMCQGGARNDVNNRECWTGRLKGPRQWCEQMAVGYLLVLCHLCEAGARREAWTRSQRGPCNDVRRWHSDVWFGCCWSLARCGTVANDVVTETSHVCDGPST